MYWLIMFGRGPEEATREEERREGREGREEIREEIRSESALSRGSVLSSAPSQTPPSRTGHGDAPQDAGPVGALGQRDGGGETVPGASTALRG